MQSTELLRHSSSGALLACGMLPLKRFRLSASPATGLVGMQENTFLSDFFGCVGFLPLTTPSHIRGEMVRMMTLSTAPHRPDASYDSLDQGQFGAIFSEDGITTGNQLSAGPSACTFWCAVGVGALVKGSPVESVANYSRLARDALDAYTGPVNAEVAMAWAILGYFYGFMGDTATFQEYLGLADSFLTDSIERGSTNILPAGFAEIIRLEQTVKVYTGHLDAAYIDFLGSRRGDPPQVNPAANEGDLFRYFSQSLNAFEELVFEKACEKSSIRRHLSDDEPWEEDRGGGSPHGAAPQAEDVSDAMVMGLQDGLIDFEHLQETVDRSNIRKGIGGLLINMYLAFQKAGKGDAGGALERLGHCVEAFERYPGVCRCMMLWCHASHSILGALAAIKSSRARELYNRLRDVYNPSRPASFLPAPPLEEWHGTSSFCDDFQCRCFEGIIASRARNLFPAPSDCTSNNTDQQQTNCTEDYLEVVDEEHDGSIISAGVIPEKAIGSIMDAPCSNGDKPMASTSLWELNQEPAPQMGPPVGPSLSTSHVHCCGPDTGGGSGTDIYSGAVEGCGGGVLAGLVAPVPDMSLRLPELTQVDGVPEETGDDTIAAADWLDVTHAMLGAFDQIDPAL
ncbi:expressed unknown protein [Ectocarpus siliculosus]|uniref:Uncharacterized protein n=1 Tax=Ectocarpus siliculosus TaxID=2880 RepID=D8LU24_ECTSI|nr:expressed unknown protein [Ectocarpus siliculosus]|eukprot:CBN75414.1 expressed unknown protein [Ectocarpus siliculosus]